ncbi:MAG: isomerase [Bacteroidetes bacterium GWF2_42_66]|nr:MAG: isomerase [Bacteroidetes bacterium GWA2_42_15]OFX98629.1 MAG: isomerase [Bacteroidetes bacterium GWE2_42_39]OFY43174.1 MAG: isomerase [Bacteroidetes bacterium GWF2_42_66]HBL76973.1 isomerase [Prolixibacteraceae bacterium]HCR89625.1 isomerase [Prolixibacteraceae bacterium]
MKLDLFQADAFASGLFAGNPAAVVPLTEWLPDQTMQQIAMENNLSETAFFVAEGENYHIRWFTPLAEVALCGHATLASAHILFAELGFSKPVVRFMSKSGLLTVERKGGLLELNFPADFVKPAILPDSVARGIIATPLEVYKGKTDYLLFYPSEEIIKNLKPGYSLLKTADARGIIVTAPGITVDFVSRFFAPAVGIDEDPVTGSAHTLLTPFWSARLQKKTMTAMQLSKRGGHLTCTLDNDRVLIAGKAVTYLKGEIRI